MNGSSVSYDLRAYEEIIVLGGGKAAGQAARALESVLGDRIDGGLVVTTDPEPTDRIEVRVGTHPIPSPENVAATVDLLERAETADRETLILAPITGGGSALLAAPAPGIELADLRTVTDDLLRAGLSIHRVNAVRKHLSTIKGGQLAATAAPATVVGLLFSDVVGDDASVIASGPTVPDPSTFAEALAAIERAEVDVSAAIEERLRRGLAGDSPETPDASELPDDRLSNHVLTNGYTAIEAARRPALEAGFTPLVLSSRIQGSAREAARFHGAVLAECLERGEPVDPPAVILSGGETTVSVDGDGRGGPNLEFALATSLDLDEADGVTVASVDTDGIDGNSEAAGALVTGATTSEESEARRALDRNDAFGYLTDRDATIQTGPTGTNVNDLRVIVLSSQAG